MRSAPRVFVVGVLLLTLSMSTCGSDGELVADGSVAVERTTCQFTVRGRWEAPVVLSYRIEDRGCPIPVEQWRSEVERACATGSETGVVSLVEAAPDDEADVTLGWRRGHHGACEPFGINTTVAHSGPVQPGTFIHFDADRQWQQDASAGGYSLHGTAVHELGHVLGLGHSEAPDAVMRTGVIRSAPLARADLAGLQSLYGGGSDRPGDLRVLGGQGLIAAVLRGVAPAEITEFDVFDADGDGCDDLLVWRSDPAGSGALMIYQFDRGPKLARTSGPFYGMSVPGRANLFLRSEAGDRLMVGIYENGRLVVRRFDDYAVLGPWRESAVLEQDVDRALALRRSAGSSRVGDLDGDGRPETVIAVR